jgi:anti-sigma factor RsiW
MGCEEFKNLTHGYLDGELDLVRSIEVEHHLEECPSCLRAYENTQAMRAAMREGSLYHHAPPALRDQIASAVCDEAGGSMRISPSSNSNARWWIGIAAAIFATAAITWQFAPRTNNSPSYALASDELVSDHIRSLLANHLTDVVSTDQHTVKPWFNGRLDFSPPVQNLADEGFPLIGGRLDYANSRSVAALVYQHQKHFINVFIWPTNESPSNTTSLTIHGYRLVQWSSSGMTFAAVSDTSSIELDRFVQLLQKEPTTSPVNSGS